MQTQVVVPSSVYIKELGRFLGVCALGRGGGREKNKNMIYLVIMI